MAISTERHAQSNRRRAKGTITANTFQQLSTRTWAQLTQWTKLCFTSRWFTLTTDQMYYRNAREAWFVSAQSCKEENSEAFAGQHAADSTSFYIFDEASGVPDKIFEVAEGGLTDGEPIIFLFGNPTGAEGKFFRVNFGSERERWEHRSVDSRKCRFTNKDQLEQWVSDYGEDSDFCRVRIKGECPRAGTSQLIPQDLVANCREFRAQGFHNLPKIIGCDPARYGDDRSTIVVRQGRQARARSGRTSLAHYRFHRSRTDGCGRCRCRWRGRWRGRSHQAPQLRPLPVRVPRRHAG